jgi:hypothetical protein
VRPLWGRQRLCLPVGKKATYVNLVRLVAVGCALPLLAACGAGPYSVAAQDVQPLTARSTSTTTSHESRAGADNRRELGNGLMITVSAPKAFTPTDAAYPRSPRAVAFELIIDNEGTDGYRPAQLSVTATCNGTAAPQVIDSTQGYTGSVGTTEEVPPGQRVRLAVAFGIPREQTEVALLVQPDALDGGQIRLFEGTV